MNARVTITIDSTGKVYTRDFVQYPNEEMLREQIDRFESQTSEQNPGLEYTIEETIE